jgi:hypothetical protein
MESIRHMVERHQADERIRQTQQGLGRPIIGIKSHGHQLVAVGDTLFHSPTWKTFPDFLADYIKRILDPAWGNAEIGKAIADRHPIVQWYDAFARYQQATIKVPGEVHSAPMTGVVACYLGLAYSLYLLAHNVELQNRLIRRLKDPGNFQGAYYELIVANTLIRAGFTLTLEDETDAASKHCEFAAVSKLTGKKYWVEAKMRAVSGLLGKNDRDGTSDLKPTSQLIPHLNAALAKPAADERLIFIDLNAEVAFDADGRPAWHDKVVKRLEQYETRELPAGVTAYLFVTNMPFHRMLAQTPSLAAVPFGLGIDDFNRPGFLRLSEVYRQRQKHADAHLIGQALIKYTQFPTTFDGRLPSEAFGKTPSRVTIGETYFFENVGDGGIVGTVTTATMNEPEKQVYIGVTDQHGVAQILRQPISDAEFADYKAHPDAYFGRIQPVQKAITDRYEFFEWHMEVNKALPREALLERLKAAPNFEEVKTLSDSELLAIYCEGLVASFEAAGFRTNPYPAPPNHPPR